MRIFHPGAWYADATPDQAWAALFPSVEIRTSRGAVPLPRGGNLLALRGKVIRNVLCLVGQGHEDGRAWLWVDKWYDLGQTYGTSPCAFGPDGDVYVSTPGATDNLLIVDAFTRQIVSQRTQPIGARGIAHVDSQGRVTGIDEWYGREGFAEYTDLDTLRIGQGAQDGIVVRVGSTARRLLEPGSCKFVRVSKDGDRVAVAAWKDVERGAVLHWLTLAELAALPLVSTSVPPLPPPPIPVPEPEPEPMATYPDEADLVRATADAHPALLTRMRASSRATDSLRERLGNDHPDVKAGEHTTDALKGEMCRVVVSALHQKDARWGLRRKDSGAHAVRSDGAKHATDCAMWQPDGKIIDVLSDYDVGWSNRDGDFQPVNQWLAPLPEGETPGPVKPPTEPPTGPVDPQFEARLADLEETVTRRLAQVGVRLDRNDLAIDALENRLGTTTPALSAQTLKVVAITLKVEP